MPKRGHAVHVATTERKYKGKTYRSVLLRRSYREDGRVKHETLGNLSHLPPEAIEAIRLVLKGESVAPLEQRLECVRSLPHGHVMAVLGTIRRLGLDAIIASRGSRQRDLVLAMIAARIISPGSKLATCRALRSGTAETSLGDALGVADASDDELYAAMDWLLDRQQRIESQLAERHLDNVLVLYDLTSVYFEGRRCPLAKLGYNRDGKPGKLQIVVGLLCDRQGRPIATEVFEGNTGDPKTLAAQVAKLRERFGLDRVVLVADRGTITSARIREDLDPVEGLSWITALRSTDIKELIEQGAVSPSLFDERDLAEITVPEYPGQRLMVCRNPLLAAARAQKRDELLAATEREFEKIAAATQRAKNPLRGAAKIGLRVGAIKGKYKVAKHFALTITDDVFGYERKVDQIAAEAELDGLYVVRTNIPAEQLSADDTVRAYKSLSQIERAFRSMKSIDLKIRPVYHYREDRVRAHVLLCALAYYVEWHMREALAPLLFQDDDPEAAEDRRESVVAKAVRSESAMAKLASGRTDDGFPVESFRSLLALMGTIVKNSMRPQGSTSDTFTITTVPTLHQQRVLDLLDVRLGA